MKIHADTEVPGSVGVRFTAGENNRFTEKDGALSLEVGAGTAPLNRRQSILLWRKIVSVAKQNNLKNISVSWEELRAFAAAEIEDGYIAATAAMSFGMADFEFTAYKTPPKDGFAHMENISITGAPAALLNAWEAGSMIAQEINSCRALANTPGGDMTPSVLAQAAIDAVAGTEAIVHVHGRDEMEKLGMGAVLGIAKGSAEEPKFLVVEYWGTDKSQKPLVLIGKGVTFDTGGLNIKTGDNMYEMHMDMSGGAAVIHAAALAAKMKLKSNVIALVPAVENAPGANAVRPGDQLRSLSGKTIEILNTDAEGRVIMSDAITYAKRYDPRAVVNVSTLTGAALIALGTQASAVMTRDQEFENLLRELGEKSGDYVWPFPLWDEYEIMTKGHFGDVPNISTFGNSRYGGVIAGGMFLWQFAKELNCPWAHIDMAPRMTANPNEYLSPGAVGAPVALLFSLIAHYAR